MKKIILLPVIVFCFCIATSKIYAQTDYKTAVGLGIDFGYGTIVGPSIKHFFNNNNAIQGDILFGNEFAAVGAYYQYHRSFKEAEQLKWYLGLGPQIFITDKGRICGKTYGWFRL